MKLVIIEGPGKQATIKKYLGEDYTVFASKGHVRDLPTKSMSIDINNNFKPTYEIMPDKKKIVDEMKKLASKSESVLIATDPDREGEAIGWHIAYILNLPADAKCRITFNEISQSAVTNALKHPRTISQDLVEAQQTRRLLDRLVGYKLSPIVSKKLYSTLSAGRVQSVALKMIVDREREILNFKPEEYWDLKAVLEKDNIKFKSALSSKNNKKFVPKNKEQVQEILDVLNNSVFEVNDVKRELKKVHPQPPFITSSMQQDAGQKLKMSLDTITKTAQQLYEGVSTKSYGKKALITYIRTDSTRVSPEAQVKTKQYIIEKFGDKYVPQKFNFYKSKESAQEGHEAIRPIDISITPDSLKSEITSDQFKLYKLIYDRFIASQMSDAVYDSLSVEIKSDIYKFKVSGRTLVFDGYNIIYSKVKDDDDTSDDDLGIKLPNLQVGDKLTLIELLSEQKFTKPPVRYTEPTFIKGMESNGIGRPATYAQTVSVLSKRNYFIKDGKYFVPSEIGCQVVDFLTENFKEIMDVKFTADMESKLDEIAEGKIDWLQVMNKFYKFFEKELGKVDKSAVFTPVETDYICEKCGAKMIIRNGKNGKFLACPNFPKCKFTKNLNEDGVVVDNEVIETDEICENCGAKMVVKNGKNGKFLACPNFPKCKNTKPYVEDNLHHGICPDCGGVVEERVSKNGKHYVSCLNYPNCKFMSWDLPLEEKCPICGKNLYLKLNDNTKYCVSKCNIIQNNNGGDK